MNKSNPIAIIYDFDKTLCTKDMQEYGFIPSLGMTSCDFWGEINKLTMEEKVDPVLSYLCMMIQLANEKGVAMTRENLQSFGKNIEYYPGVLDWFSRVEAYGKENEMEVEQYVISSGLKEIIEGSEINKYFTRVYACEYLYDNQGKAIWPKMTVNYTNKTQFLFRINKGVLDVIDDKGINEYLEKEARRIPFENMIYIGDGLTDVPCMRLVKQNGGCSIAVFKKMKKNIANQLMKDNRVNFMVEADYSKDSELDRIMHTMIAKIAMEQQLRELHQKHLDSIF